MINMKSLNLCNNELITNEGIKNMSELQNLNLFNNSKITN